MLVLSFLLRWALLAGAVLLAAWATPDAAFRGGPVDAMVVAVLISLANVVAQLVLRAVPKPSNFLLLAALTLLVNGVAVWVASGFTTRLHIGGPVAAVAFALEVSVFSIALNWLASRFVRRYEKG